MGHPIFVAGMNNVCKVFTATITPNGRATLPFVIPSEAEGSAVLLISSEDSLASSSGPAVRRNHLARTMTPHGLEPAFTFLVTVLVARSTTEMLFEGPLAE